MARRLRDRLIIPVVVVVVLAGWKLFRYYQQLPSTGDLIAVAQSDEVRKGKSVSEFLADHCDGPIEWKHSRSAEGKDIIEASGRLRENQAPVKIRWNVFIQRSKELTISAANFETASIGSEELDRSSFFKRLTSADEKK